MPYTIYFWHGASADIVSEIDSLEHSVRLPDNPPRVQNAKPLLSMDWYDLTVQ